MNINFWEATNFIRMARSFDKNTDVEANVSFT